MPVASGVGNALASEKERGSRFAVGRVQPRGCWAPKSTAARNTCVSRHFGGVRACARLCRITAPKPVTNRHSDLSVFYAAGVGLSVGVEPFRQYAAERVRAGLGGKHSIQKMRSIIATCKTIKTLLTYCSNVVISSALLPCKSIQTCPLCRPLRVTGFIRASGLAIPRRHGVELKAAPRRG